MNNPFKRSEIDPKIIEAIKDNDKALRQYLLQVFAAQIIERVTMTILVASVPSILALIAAGE